MDIDNCHDEDYTSYIMIFEPTETQWKPRKPHELALQKAYNFMMDNNQIPPLFVAEILDFRINMANNCIDVAVRARPLKDKSIFNGVAPSV